MSIETGTASIETKAAMSILVAEVTELNKKVLVTNNIS
jgi:hypothetical protein